MTKILQLTSAHTAKELRVFMKTACSLAAAGYEVVMVAPNAEQEVYMGIQIKGFRSRGGRWGRFLVAPFAIARMIVAEKADVVHFHDPDLLWVGLLTKLLGSKAVYDVHEDFSAAVYDRAWIPNFLRTPVAVLFGFFERLAVRFCAAAVAATPRISLRFPASKTIVTNNYPLPSEIRTEQGLPFAERSKSFVYIGNISRERGVLKLIEAAQISHQGSRAIFDLAGGFTDEELERQVLSFSERPFFNYRGYIDRTQVAELLSDAIAGMVTFLPLPNHLDSRPNKMFEYMSAGLPVIASDFPAWREMIEEQGCGLCVDPEDPEKIAEAMNYLLTHLEEAQEMGARGRVLVVDKMNWGEEEKKLISLYGRLVGPSGVDRPA